MSLAELLLLNTIDKQLDYLYEYVDDCLIKGDFDIVDDNILEFIEECESFALFIGFLTITFRYNNKLKNLEKLQMKAISIGQKIMSLEDSLSTMHGLISNKIIKIKMRNEKLKQINEKYL